MNMLPQEVEQESTLEQRVKNSKIKGILENSLQAQRLIEEIVRYGDSVTQETIIAQIVYQSLGVPKDEDNIPFYRNFSIRINDSKIPTRKVFSEKFPDINIESLIDGNDLITWTFGEEITDFFHYAQERLNSTGFQRIGGEKLNDAYIFVHSTRVLGRMKTPYEKRLALLHDVIEDLTKFRDNERDRLGKERDGAIEKAKEEGMLQEGIDIIARGYNKEIKLYEKQIRNPPERKDIIKMFESYFAGIYKDKRKAAILSILAINHLDLLTRKITSKGKEDYSTYIKRLDEGVDSKGIQRLLKSAGIEGEEAMKFYEAPVLVKLADSLDNTERSREIDILRNYNRLDHNLILLRMVGRYIEKHNIKEGKIVDKRNDFYKTSMTELNFNIDTRYNKDPNPHVQDYLRRLSELRDSYREIPATSGKSSSFSFGRMFSFMF